MKTFIKLMMCIITLFFLNLHLKAYNSEGYPSFENLNKNIVYLNSGQTELLINNVSDGNNQTQEIAFTAVSSDVSIVDVDSVIFKTGDRYARIYITEKQKAGTVNISVKATDTDGTLIKNFSVSVVQYGQIGATYRCYDVAFWQYVEPDMSTIYKWDTINANYAAPYATMNFEKIGMSQDGYNNNHFTDALFAWLIPKTSGVYSFKFSTADHADFWLYSAPSGPDTLAWLYRGRKRTEHLTSQAVNLEAGKAYRMVAYHWIANNGRNLKVLWKKPGSSYFTDIPKDELLAYFDIQKPTAVNNLILVKKTTEKIYLSWNKSTDNNKVSGYNVYVNGVKNNLTTLLNLKYTIEGLASGTVYNIHVTAIDNANNESLIGSGIKVSTYLNETNFPTPPSTINLLQVSGNAIKIDWTGATDDTEVTSYNIYVDDVKVNSAINLTNNFIIYGLIPKTTYAIKVTAIDPSGNESTKSISKQVTTSTFDPTGTIIEGEYRARAVVKLKNLGWNEGIGINVDLHKGVALSNSSTDIKLQSIIAGMKPGAIRWGTIGANTVDFNEATLDKLAKSYDLALKNNAIFTYCVGIGQVHNGTAFVGDTMAFGKKNTTAYADLLEFFYGPSTSTFGAKRASRGFTDPFPIGKGLIIELGNEVWGSYSLHNVPVGGDQYQTKYPDFVRDVTKKIMDSPYYQTHKDKIWIAASGRRPETGSQNSAVSANQPNLNCLAVSGYLSGNLNYDPAIPFGSSELLFNQFLWSTAEMYLNGLREMQKEYMIDGNGAAKTFYMYESNATDKLYWGRYGMGMIAIDYLTEALPFGSIVPSLFNLISGQWQCWDLSTDKPRPIYTFAKFYNTLAKESHILETKCITNNKLTDGMGGTLYTLLPVGVKAYTNGTNYSVMLFNRDFENTYSIQLDLPNDLIYHSSARMYRLTNDDFSSSDVVIDSSDITLTDSMYITLAKHTAVFIKFTGADMQLSKLHLGFYDHVIGNTINLKANPPTNKTDIILTAIVGPDESLSKKVAWSFISNSIGAKLSVQSTSNCKISSANKGKVKVRASVNENKSIYQDMEIEFTETGVVVFDSLTSNIANRVKNSIHIYPNPANDILYLDFENTEICKLQMFDLTGRMVMDGEIINKSINIASLNSGIYLLKVSNINENKIFRIIKK